MAPRLLVFLQSALLLLLTLSVVAVTAFHIPDPIVHFGVGAIAGGAGAVAYQPFDYIKAQVQSDRGGQLSGLACLLKTVQDDPSKLFRGMTASVTGVAPEKSLKLGVNDVLRDGFTAYYGTPFLPLWSQVFSGAIAGACQTIVSSPMDVMKIRMQTRENGETTTAEEPSFGQLLNEVGGVPGLYRGVETCLARDISFTALCMPLYSCLIGSGLDAFSAGALSGILSTFVATPFDMVKTRILTNDEESSYSAVVEEAEAVPATEIQVQMQASGAAVLSMGGGGGNSTMMGASYDYAMPSEEVVSWNRQPASNHNHHNRQTNPLQLAQQIMDKEGLGALFTGANERCVGAIPRFGITLGVHEWLEHYCHGVGLLS